MRIRRPPVRRRLEPLLPFSPPQRLFNTRINDSRRFVIDAKLAKIKVEFKLFKLLFIQERGALLWNHRNVVVYYLSLWLNLGIVHGETMRMRKRIFGVCFLSQNFKQKIEFFVCDFLDFVFAFWACERTLSL